jgi:hypothetical protein
MAATGVATRPGLNDALYTTWSQCNRHAAGATATSPVPIHSLPCRVSKATVGRKCGTTLIAMAKACRHSAVPAKL